MKLLEKLNKLEYMYEPIKGTIFLYKKRKEPEFILVDEEMGIEKLYDSVNLLQYLSTNDFNLVNLELMIDNNLIEQCMFYKMELDITLDLLEMTVEEIKQMEDELKNALKDITKQFIKRRLTLVETEE